MNNKEMEENLVFTPCFDENGLIPCITTCFKSGEVLMFAFMNKDALQKTLQSGEAHYWSRSRKRLWHKGESSGYTQRVIEMRTDCDQDCIWIRVEVNAPDNDLSKGAACHTGRKTCFYRQIAAGVNNLSDASMRFSDDSKPLFDPDAVYNKNN